MRTKDQLNEEYKQLCATIGDLVVKIIRTVMVKGTALETEMQQIQQVEQEIAARNPPVVPAPEFVAPVADVVPPKE